MINELEILILSTAQAVYDVWGWQLMLISEHQLPTSMIPIGEFYTAIGNVLGASIAYWVARMDTRWLIAKCGSTLSISNALNPNSSVGAEG